MDTLLNALDMGKHAPYVWTAYGVTVLVFVLLVWLPLRARRQFLRREKRRIDHAS